MADGKPILSVCHAAQRRVFINNAGFPVQVCIVIYCVVGKSSLSDSREQVKERIVLGKAVVTAIGTNVFGEICCFTVDLISPMWIVCFNFCRLSVDLRIPMDQNWSYLPVLNSGKAVSKLSSYKHLPVDMFFCSVIFQTVWEFTGNLSEHWRKKMIEQMIAYPLM